MKTKERATISDAEWEVMRVVWTNKQTTSREIIAILESKMNWKPATIKTLIGRLVEKGMLETKPEGNKYLYQAAVSEEESVEEKSSAFFEHICNKKAGKTLAYLLEEAELSFDDVALLEKVLQQKKQEAVTEVSCKCTPGQCNCKASYDEA